MKPKKRILLIDQNENRQSLTRYRLHIHSFAVLSASSAAEACSFFEIDPPDLVIVASDIAERDCLLKLLHERNPFIPRMVIVEGRSECNAIADAILYNPPQSKLLERVKVISARKRGPHFAKPPVSDWRTEAERITARHQVEAVLGVEMPARRIA